MVGILLIVEDFGKTNYFAHYFLFLFSKNKKEKNEMGLLNN